MNRSAAQRLGDITLVLAVFAALTVLARTWTAADISDGDRDMFWSYFGLSASGALFPAFGGACASCWMDDARRPLARAVLLAVLVVVALGIVGDVFLGSRELGGGIAGSFLQDAASLLLVAGAFTLLAGVGPTRDEPREV
jgi:hypothetical protein